jgi:hypothetical protein
MNTLLAALLLSVPVEWAEIPFHRLLQRSRLVVAGEVVEVVQVPGRPIARLKVAHTFKGKAEAETIEIPFKTTITWGCDFKIEYQKGKKYLLLLDNGADFRVVYYPMYTFTEIASYDLPFVSVTRLGCDLMEGKRVQERVKELVAMTEDPNLRTYAFDLFRIVPRALARPHLSRVRTAYADHRLARSGREPVDGVKAHPFPLRTPADAEISRDLSLLSHLLNGPSRPESLKSTCALLTGWNVSDLDSFERSWATAVQRSTRKSKGVEVDALLSLLGAPEGAVREQATNALLDLGPDVIDRVKGGMESRDPEVRARIQGLLLELELLQDLRADLEAVGR